MPVYFSAPAADPVGNQNYAGQVFVVGDGLSSDDFRIKQVTILAADSESGIDEAKMAFQKSTVDITGDLTIDDQVWVTMVLMDLDETKILGEVEAGLNSFSLGDKHVMHSVGAGIMFEDRATNDTGQSIQFLAASSGLENTSDISNAIVYEPAGTHFGALLNATRTPVNELADTDLDFTISTSANSALVAFDIEIIPYTDEDLSVDELAAINADDIWLHAYVGNKDVTEAGNGEALESYAENMGPVTFNGVAQYYLHKPFIAYQGQLITYHVTHGRRGPLAKCARKGTGVFDLNNKPMPHYDVNFRPLETRIMAFQNDYSLLTADASLTFGRKWGVGTTADTILTAPQATLWDDGRKLAVFNTTPAGGGNSGDCTINFRNITYAVDGFTIASEVATTAVLNRNRDDYVFYTLRAGNTMAWYYRDHKSGRSGQI